jgi:hypothetical protein
VLLEELGDSLSPRNQRWFVVATRKLMERWPQQSVVDRQVLSPDRCRNRGDGEWDQDKPESERLAVLPSGQRRGSARGPDPDPGQAAARSAGNELLVAFPM